MQMVITTAFSSAQLYSQSKSTSMCYAPHSIAMPAMQLQSVSVTACILRHPARYRSRDAWPRSRHAD
eukprot:1701411-Rhodomonas_salina.1